MRDALCVQVVSIDLSRDPANGSMWLSSDEHARAARFRFARDRERWIRARAGLRAVLADALATAPSHLSFGAGAYGKPFLGGEFLGALAFNLSHAGDLALVAWCHASAAPGRLPELGIDLERVVPVPELDDVARHHFAPAEQEALFALDPARRTAAFHRLWTRKEACIKALGTGLSLPLHSFAVTLQDDDVRVRHLDGDDAERWSLRHLEPAPGYVGALAVRAPDVVVRDGPRHVTEVAHVR